VELPEDADMKPPEGYCALLEEPCLIQSYIYYQKKSYFEVTNKPSEETKLGRRRIIIQKSRTAYIEAALKSR
jgi:hypothetical protein